MIYKYKRASGELKHLRALAGSRKLYRGFESLSLRHAVCTAQKSVGPVPKTAEYCGNSATFALKVDWRE